MVKVVGLPVHVLPDGGRIEVTGRRIVPMGDVFAYEELTYTRPGSKSTPAVRAVFRVRSGVPVCSSASIETDSQTGVRQKDLTALCLADLREEVYATAGVFERNPKGGYVHVIGRKPQRQYRRHIAGATSRRKLTPETLAQVAEVHRTAEGSKIEAIAAAFGIGRRQAHRYKNLATDEGLIGDE